MGNAFTYHNLNVVTDLTHQLQQVRPKDSSMLVFKLRGLNNKIL
jgi:hypothetical protein